MMRNSFSIFLRATRAQFSQIRSFSKPARLFMLATLMDGIVFSG
jgi:hypothetical protein